MLVMRIIDSILTAPCKNTSITGQTGHRAGQARIVSDMSDPSPTVARSPLMVVPWDPVWPVRAADLVTELARRIGPAARRIEHIGSTAIPGMAAKPVYDLQVSVTDLVATADVIDSAVLPLGLARFPWERDHVPAGSADPPERWAKRAWAKPAPGGERIHLHARLVGSPNERLALLFRDWFRAHPTAVPAYARFKTLLAAALDDIDTYTDIKDPVVDLVIAVADDWAAETGWTP